MKGRLSIGILSHVSALLAGIGIAGWSGAARDGVGGVSADRSRGLAVDSGRAVGRQRGLSASDLSRTWEELATTPMTAIERAAIKQRLIAEWMERDPVGLLEFLDGKNSWPRALDRIGSGLCSSELGRLAPERLFEYIRREGYQDAMFYGLGDSDTALLDEILGRLPAGERGEVWAKILADHVEKASEERVVALYREGRYEELGEVWSGLGEEEVRERIGDVIAEGLYLERMDEKLVTELLRLPKELAEAVIKDLVWDPAWDHEATWMAFREARDTRRRVAEQMARAGLSSAAEGALAGMALGNWDPPHDPLQGAAENVEWVSGLPEDPCFDCLRNLVFTDWWSLDRDAAVAAIGEMPAGRVRDSVVADVAEYGRRHHWSGEDPEKKEEQIDFLVGLLSDPELRAKLDPPEDDGDPFAPEADPFAE